MFYKYNHLTAATGVISWYCYVVTHTKYHSWLWFPPDNTHQRGLVVLRVPRTWEEYSHVTLSSPCTVWYLRLFQTQLSCLSFSNYIQTIRSVSIVIISRWLACLSYSVYICFRNNHVAFNHTLYWLSVLARLLLTKRCKHFFQACS